MKKQIYRLRRAYGGWAAGEEIELTKVEAIELDNAAPGVVERVMKGEYEPPSIGSVTQPTAEKSPRVTKEDV